MTTKQFQIIKSTGNSIDLKIIERILERNGVEPTDSLLHDLLSFHLDPEEEVTDYQKNVLHQDMSAS